MASPSGRARATNSFEPVIDPPPGTLRTTTLGLPGRYFDRYGAKKRAQTSEPPPSENGIHHSTVLPAKSTDA